LRTTVIVSATTAELSWALPLRASCAAGAYTMPVIPAALPLNVRAAESSLV
jgi:hypothetical protein